MDFKGGNVEIVINEQTKIEWIIAFCILIIGIGFVVRPYFIKNARAYTTKFEKTIVLIFVAFIGLIMLNPFFSSLDYCFNNSNTAIVNVEEIIVSASFTQIKTKEHLRNFRIRTNGVGDSTLDIYFVGHICEIEYLEFGRDIIRIEVLE